MPISMQFAAMNSVTLKGLSKRDAASGNSLFSMIQMLAIGLGVTKGGGQVGMFSGETNATLGSRILASAKPVCRNPRRNGRAPQL